MLLVDIKIFSGSEVSEFDLLIELTVEERSLIVLGPQTGSTLGQAICSEPNQANRDESNRNWVADT